MDLLNSLLTGSVPRSLAPYKPERHVSMLVPYRRAIESAVARYNTSDSADATARSMAITLADATLGTCKELAVRGSVG